MDKQQIFDLMTNNRAFFLATCEGGEPRVRGMLLYRADENGIIFHTGPHKDVYHQILENPNVQLCFYDGANNVQVRVRGVVEQSNDLTLKKEIETHPTRGFMQAWRGMVNTEEEFYNMFSVFTLKNGLANVWTFMSNFTPKEDIQL